MPRGTVALLAALSILFAACTSSGSAQTNDAGSITVLAAASLTDAFTDLARDFEEEHPGVEVLLSFGPTDGLATQIVEGAPADVFASASTAWADAVATEGPGLDHLTDLARNRLVVITPPDDPAGIAEIGDLAEPGVRLVLAAAAVPAGSYAREALANAGVADVALANVVSNEDDVKAVVQKVVLGEADAGIVYATDVTDDVAPEVRSVPIPADVNVIATYPIGVVGDSPSPALAADFVRLATGPDGQRVLRSFGFLPP